jgi:hypothetical protein
VTAKTAITFTAPTAAWGTIHIDDEQSEETTEMHKNVVDSTLALLATRQRDVVTGMQGVVTSVCFDVSGCVQATLDRGFDDKGARLERFWVDVKQLRRTGDRVMAVPDFAGTPPGREVGAADKPAK